jgi:hypothetical protein
MTMPEMARELRNLWRERLRMISIAFLCLRPRVPRDQARPGPSDLPASF